VIWRFPGAKDFHHRHKKAARLVLQGGWLGGFAGGWCEGAQATRWGNWITSAPAASLSR